MKRLSVTFFLAALEHKQVMRELESNKRESLYNKKTEIIDHELACFGPYWEIIRGLVLFESLSCCKNATTRKQDIGYADIPVVSEREEKN